MTASRPEGAKGNPAMLMVSCGCIVSCLQDGTEHMPSVVYCKAHSAAPEMFVALLDLVERLDRDVPAHACPGFDCATCARPNTEPARALLAQIETP